MQPAIVVVLCVWNVLLSLSVAKLIRQKTSKLKSSFHDLSSGTDNIQIGVHRFNAFPDTTGEQSFSISLTDSQESGIILTSLHTKTNTRLYVKSLQNGKPEKGSLSETEKLAILNPITTNIKNE